MITRFEAAVALNTGKPVGQDGDIGLFIDGVKVIDFTEIDKKVIELQAEYDAQEYARNRASAYDSVGNQLDMLMKDMRDGTTTHQTACEAVKAKYPKP